VAEDGYRQWEAFVDATAGHGGGNERENSLWAPTLAHRGRRGRPLRTRRRTWGGRRGVERSEPPGLLPRQKQAQRVEYRTVPAGRPSENRGCLQCRPFPPTRPQEVRYLATYFRQQKRLSAVLAHPSPPPTQEQRCLSLNRFDCGRRLPLFFQQPPQRGLHVPLHRHNHPAV